MRVIRRRHRERETRFRRLGPDRRRRRRRLHRQPADWARTRSASAATGRRNTSCCGQTSKNSRPSGKRQSTRAEPRTWPASGGSRPPASVRLQPASSARPGHDFEVSAKVAAPAGVKWVRLRYRHVTQFEDYQTSRDDAGQTDGPVRRRIPASFIDPHWDLMYFIEAVDQRGAGRMSPDLEVETPYVVIAVNRKS